MRPPSYLISACIDHVGYGCEARLVEVLLLVREGLSEVRRTVSARSSSHGIVITMPRRDFRIEDAPAVEKRSLSVYEEAAL